MNMLFTVMGIAAVTDMSFGERAAYSLRMTVVGMLMIFTVLCMLWAVLSLSKILFYDVPKKRAGKAKAQPQGEKAVAPAPAAPTVPAPVTPVSDAALVAAITAAIAAMRADEGCSDGFRVVSFRRADSSRSWNRK